MSEEKIKCPECGKEVTKNKAILTCPNCGMTFCSKCMEQLQAGMQECPYCGNKKEQPKPEPTKEPNKGSDPSKPQPTQTKQPEVKQNPKVNPRPNNNEDNSDAPKLSGEIPDPEPSRPKGPYRPGDYTSKTWSPATRPAQTKPNLWERIKKTIGSWFK